MQSLYELTAEHQHLASLAADGDESFADALADTLSATSEQLEDKIEATVIVARQLEAEAAMCDEEAKRLQARSKTMKANAKACKDRVAWAMEAAGHKSIKRPLFTITRQAGKQVAAVDDAEALPKQFVTTKITRSPDKRLILESLKAGEEIPGCRLDTGAASLRIS